MKRKIPESAGDETNQTFFNFVKNLEKKVHIIKNSARQRLGTNKASSKIKERLKSAIKGQAYLGRSKSGYIKGRVNFQKESNFIKPLMIVNNINSMNSMNSIDSINSLNPLKYINSKKSSYFPPSKITESQNEEIKKKLLNYKKFSSIKFLK